jgi:hypothetical protein
VKTIYSFRGAQVQDGLIVNGTFFTCDGDAYPGKAVSGPNAFIPDSCPEDLDDFDLEYIQRDPQLTANDGVIVRKARP